jgi:hypothetical protein
MSVTNSIENIFCREHIPFYKKVFQKNVFTNTSLFEKKNGKFEKSILKLYKKKYRPSIQKRGTCSQGGHAQHFV